MAHPGVVSCDECWDIKKAIGKEPDCETCNKPELLSENENIYAFWQIIADQRDINGVLRIEAVISVLEVYDATLEDLEKIMVFDRVFRQEREKHKEED
jgi:hypothetical protein